MGTLNLRSKLCLHRMLPAMWHRTIGAKLGKNSVNSRILRASGMFSGIRILSLLCGVIRNKLFAVFAGPAGFGLVLLYNQAIDVIGTLTRLSIDQSAVRDVAKDTEPTHQAIITESVRRWSIWLGLGGMLIFCALAPLLSIWTSGSANGWWKYCLLSIVLPILAYTGGSTAIATGQQRLAAVGKAQLFSTLLAIVINCALIIWLGIQAVIPVIIISAVTLFIGLKIYAPIKSNPRVSTRQCINQGKDFIRLGILMTLSAFAVQACAYLFTLYLNHKAGTATVGLYQGGYTLIHSYVGVIFAGIWMEYYPRLSRAAHSRLRTQTAVTHEIYIALCIIIPIVLGFIAFDHLLVRWLYAPRFEAVIPYVSLGIVAVVPRAVSWCLSLVVVAHGEGKVFIVLETTSGIIGLGLYVAGWNFDGMAGLGASFIIWYAIYWAMTWAVCRRHYGLHIPLRIMVFGLLSTLFCLAVVALKAWLGMVPPLLLCLVTLPFAIRALLAHK